MEGPRSTLNLPATLDRLHEAMAFAEQQALALGVDPSRLMGLSLAVEEAFVNICTHAYTDNQGLVTLACHTGFHEARPSFVLEIADTGPEFNPLAIAEPDTGLGIEDRAVGGLGIHFIRHFSDHAHWRREDGRNILSIVLDSGPVRSQPKES